MTKYNLPMTLRLPFAMADQHLRLEQIVSTESSRSWAQCLPLLDAFALSRPERQFARQLLEKKRNCWLFRSNQRQFCGDFIIVDMSAVAAPRRAVSVIELKLGAELKFGGGGASNQLQRADAAVTEIVVTEKVITSDAAVTLICGDGDAVLEWMGVRRTCVRLR